MNPETEVHSLVNRLDPGPERETGRLDPEPLKIDSLICWLVPELEPGCCESSSTTPSHEFNRFLSKPMWLVWWCLDLVFDLKLPIIG